MHRSRKILRRRLRIPARQQPGFNQLLLVRPALQPLEPRRLRVPISLRHLRECLPHPALLALRSQVRLLRDRQSVLL